MQSLDAHSYLFTPLFEFEIVVMELFPSFPLDGTASSHYTAAAEEVLLLTGAYIHTRQCNPILNPLCTANLVPLILLGDEELCCHNVDSIITRSHLKNNTFW